VRGYVLIVGICGGFVAFSVTARSRDWPMLSAAALTSTSAACNEVASFLSAIALIETELDAAADEWSVRLLEAAHLRRRR
jgi:hypothetical protein